jgi:hypothetical protein
MSRFDATCSAFSSVIALAIGVADPVLDPTAVAAGVVVSGR